MRSIYVYLLCNFHFYVEYTNEYFPSTVYTSIKINVYMYVHVTILRRKSINIDI